MGAHRATGPAPRYSLRVKLANSMSAITVGGDIVHYEVLGRGRPVVLVHGWVGSWRYWIPLMQQLHLKYRVYALDLFGYGDSARNPEKYTIEHQINLLVEFMNQLGLGKAVVIGHGMGALIATEFASQYREVVYRLLIASAPLFDTGDLDSRGQRRLLTTNDFDPRKAVQQAAAQNHNRVEELPGTHADVTIARRPDSNPARPDAGGPGDVTIPSGRMMDRARLEQAAMERAQAELNARRSRETTDAPVTTGTPTLAPITTIGRTANYDNPLYARVGRTSSDNLLLKCFKRTEAEYGKLAQDVARQDDQAMALLAGTFDAGRMLDMLRSLAMPVVVVHGTDDPIIGVPDESVWSYITMYKDDILPVPLPGVRHFPMLEADSFTRLVGNFLEIPDVRQLEIKERWRRRSR